MKITKKQAKHQAARLEGLPGFPRTSAALDELLDAMIQADSEDQLAVVVTDAIQYGERCPFPSDIRRSLGAARAKPQGPLGRLDCEECHGMGFVTRFHLCEWDNGAKRDRWTRLTEGGYRDILRATDDRKRGLRTSAEACSCRLLPSVNAGEVEMRR